MRPGGRLYKLLQPGAVKVTTADNATSKLGASQGRLFIEEKDVKSSYDDR